MDLVLLTKADWVSRSHASLYILKRVGGTTGIHLWGSDVCTLAPETLCSLSRESSMEEGLPGAPQFQHHLLCRVGRPCPCPQVSICTPEK